MVAERDRIGTGVDEFVIDRLGDAEAAGRILAVDDDEIEGPILDERREPIGDCGAAGLATTSPIKRIRNFINSEVEQISLG